MIIPAILSDSISDAQIKLDKVKGISEWVQIDIMDGGFTPAVSITIEDLKKLDIQAKVELHLMVQKPDQYFELCNDLNIQRVIFHFESSQDISSVLNAMDKYKFEKGIALKSETEIIQLDPFIGKFDMVLFLQVNPGYGGQKMDQNIFKKVKEFKSKYPEIAIEVDGGVKMGNLSELKNSGVDYFVIGSGLFTADNIEEQYFELCKEIT